MKSVTWVQILDEAVCANFMGESKNPTILFSAMDKSHEPQFSLAFVGNQSSKWNAVNSKHILRLTLCHILRMVHGALNE